MALQQKKGGLETLGKSLHAMGGPCSEKRLKTSYFRTGPTHFRYSEHLRSGNDPPRVNMPAGSPRVYLNPRLLSVSFFQFKDTGGEPNSRWRPPCV